MTINKLHDIVTLVLRPITMRQTECLDTQSRIDAKLQDMKGVNEIITRDIAAIKR